MSSVAEVASGEPIAAYSIADGHPVWLVPCSKCGRTHTHGAAEGPRIPHCQKDKWTHYPEGYSLKYAGQAGDKLIAQYYRAKKITSKVRDAIAFDIRRNELRKQRRLQTKSH